MAALAAMRVHAGHAEGTGSEIVAENIGSIRIRGVMEADLRVPATRRAGTLGTADGLRR